MAPDPVSTPDVLEEALEELVDRERVPLPRQTDALRELFALFTSERGRLRRGSYLDDPRLRLAYLRYHLPLNVARSLCVLRDLLRVDPAAAEAPAFVDLGAGPGSASLTAWLTLPDRPERRFVLTDRSRAPLRAARELFAAVAARGSRPAPKIATPVRKLPELPRIAPGSIVWLGLVLNEVRPGRGGLDPARLLRSLEAGIPPGCRLVIVEPAQRVPGRRLLELHDRLIARGGWRVLAPCTHQRDCPLLRARGEPWCHAHFAWDPGPRVREIARPLGLDTTRGALAWLAARRLAPGETAGAGDPGLARAIGDPMRVRGGRQGIYVCRDGRRETLSDPPPGSERGDVLRVEPPRNAKAPRRARVEAPWPGREG